jgi:hypothetical protein
MLNRRNKARPASCFVAVQRNGSTHYFEFRVAFRNGKYPFAPWALHLIANTCDGYAHIRGFLGYGDYLAAVGGGIAKTDYAFAVFL